MSGRRRKQWLRILVITGLLLSALPGIARGQMIRKGRPPLPAVSATVEFEDLDGDGDPDVLRSVTPDGVPLQWIDDDDDMTESDRAGDNDSDCLMVDRNRDGVFGYIDDIIVDWNDEDGDGKADMQTIADNAWLGNTEWGPGHYMVVVDSDGDGVFNYINWDTYKLECWDHSGLSHFFEDYLGTSLFLKMHTSTYTIRDLRYNWENPFLFYDEDHDGVSEKAIRLLDTPKVLPAPRDNFKMPVDGSKVRDEDRRIEFTQKIDWVSIAQDLDNDSTAGNEFDFDMTIHFEGPGFDYSDQVHKFASMRGLPESDGMFYDPRWRQITELIYPDHDSVWDLIFKRGKWKQCWLVFDEDDDCHRWERVELYYPRDPFKIGKGQGGLDNHWQSDCTGDRGEWDSDASGFGKLYIGRFDGRIHLFGAEWGAWRIDQDAHYFQGWSRSGDQPERFPTIKYTDADGNGFLDRIEYDLDGDKKFERAVSLKTLGLDDKCEVVDPRSMTYEDFQRLYRKSAEQLWQRAEQAVAVATANGVDLSPYALWRRPGSLREKYHFGYWLNYYVYSELLELAEVRGDSAFAIQLDKGYFGGDWSVLTKKVADSTKIAPSVQFEVVNPLLLKRSGETVEIPWDEVKSKLAGAAADKVRVIDDTTGREIVSQVLDADGDGRPDALLFQADLPADGMHTFTVQAAPRTAGLGDPSPVHSKFVPTRMDDFAWESDRIAYRVYGPALRKENVSNGIDVWAKRVRYPIVEKWYQPGVNYHADHGEGADFYKVGETLGCGGTAIWRNGKMYRGENFEKWRILANGPIRTSFELTFRPLKIDGLTVKEVKRFSLDAGQNLTRIETVFDCVKAAGKLEFVAGLLRRENVETGGGENAPWIAMWGPIGGKGDGQMGTGVVMLPEVFIKTVEVDNHYAAIGKCQSGKPVVHWAGAGWSRSGDFNDAAAWKRHLDELAQRVASPLIVRTAGEKGGQNLSAKTMRFDFGGPVVEEGYLPVDHKLGYSPRRGYGWTVRPQHTRDRKAPGALNRDMVFSREPAKFRVDLPAGIYNFTIVVGDQDYGDHVTQVTIPGVTKSPLKLDPKQAEFVTVTLAGKTKSPIEILFHSPVNNWAASELVIEPVDAASGPKYSRKFHRPTVADRDTWQDVLSWPDPTAPLLKRFRADRAAKRDFTPTGLSREDYLPVMAGVVDFFLTLQDKHGAIIDPYRKKEFQYSTPCFALTAGALAKYAGREDLLEPAAKAMDWSCETLCKKKAATGHEDFFPVQIAHALMILKPLVAPERAAQWEKWLSSYDPYKIYAVPPGGGNWDGGENWNVISSSGEGLFHQLGIRENIDWVEVSIAAQGYRFSSPWGLYMEGPMVYDLFPRMWVADLLATGFKCRGTDKLAEMIRRGVITSLFIQSPTGELPCGGRSAHHQWNEAQECTSFEIAAAQAAAGGDKVLAGSYKRAAHLALNSTKRWVRPSGEFWVLKNRNDPAARHGYEWYTSHSQYNLLASAMLAIGYEYAESTEAIKEQPAPADVGGYVIMLEAPFNKVIANAGGMYVEIDYNADLLFNPTGLLRIHRMGCNPQLGPSDGLSADAEYALPDGPRTTAAVGVAWRDSSGNWRSLAENGYLHGKPAGRSTPIEFKLSDVTESPQRVTFSLTYNGNFDGPEKIVERYVLTPDNVEVTAELVGYNGPTRYLWPVLANDGAGELDIKVSNKQVCVTAGGTTQEFASIGASSVQMGKELYGHRNGWAKLAVAEYPAGINPAIRITPKNNLY